MICTPRSGDGLVVPPVIYRTRNLALLVARINRASSSSGPLRFTSWFRTAAGNARVCGARSSLHLTGLAVDVVPRNRVQATAAFKLAGLRVLDEGDHLHLS